ncbi:hypothetical protein H0H93_009031 [Arthromyces matolae]|nr:hypothetical protein H0H93_009031 [Arthromyces matolae]
MPRSKGKRSTTKKPLDRSLRAKVIHEDPRVSDGFFETMDAAHRALEGFNVNQKIGRNESTILKEVAKLDNKMDEEPIESIKRPARCVGKTACKEGKAIADWNVGRWFHIVGDTTAQPEDVADQDSSKKTLAPIPIQELPEQLLVHLMIRQDLVEAARQSKVSKAAAKAAKRARDAENEKNQVPRSPPWTSWSPLALLVDLPPLTKVSPPSPMVMTDPPTSDDAKDVVELAFFVVSDLGLSSDLGVDLSSQRKSYLRTVWVRPSNGLVCLLDYEKQLGELGIDVNKSLYIYHPDRCRKWALGDWRIPLVPFAGKPHVLDVR